MFRARVTALPRCSAWVTMALICFGRGYGPDKAQPDKSRTRGFEGELPDFRMQATYAADEMRARRQAKTPCRYDAYRRI